MNSLKLSVVIGCGLFAIWTGSPAHAVPNADSISAQTVGDAAKWNKLNRRYFEALLNAGSPIPDGAWSGNASAMWYTEANGSFVQKSLSTTPAGPSESSKSVVFDPARGTFAEVIGSVTRVRRVTSEQAHVFTVETLSVSGADSDSFNVPTLKLHITPEILEISDISGKQVGTMFWTSRAEAVAASRKDPQARPTAIAPSQSPHGYFGEGGRSFAFEIDGSGDALTVRSPHGTWLYRRRAGNLFAYNDHYVLQVVDAEHVVWNSPGQEVDDDPMVYQKMDPAVARVQIRAINASLAELREEMDATPYTSYEDSGSGDSSSSDSPLKATYDALVQANAEASAHLAQTQAHYDEVMDQAREQAALERAQAEAGTDVESDVSSQDVANARAATERQYEAERQFQAEQARQAALRVEEVERTAASAPAAASAPVATSSSQQGPRMGFDGRDCEQARLGAQHWVGSNGTYEVESTETKPDGWCHIVIKNWHSSGGASFQ